MDYTGLAVTVAIIVYGVLAYRHRERVYWETITYLRRGKKPPERTPWREAWKMETKGVIGLAALATVIVLVVSGFHKAGRLDTAMLSIALVFAGLFVLLSWMFLRDLRKYREFKRSARGMK